MRRFVAYKVFVGFVTRLPLRRLPDQTLPLIRERHHRRRRSRALGVLNHARILTLHHRHTRVRRPEIDPDDVAALRVPARKRRRRRSRVQPSTLGRDHVSRRISLSIKKNHAIARRSSSVPRPSPRLSSRVAVVPNLSRARPDRARRDPPPRRPPRARSPVRVASIRASRAPTHMHRASRRARRALAQKPPHRSSSRRRSKQSSSTSDASSSRARLARVARVSLVVARARRLSIFVASRARPSRRRVRARGVAPRVTSARFRRASPQRSSHDSSMGLLRARRRRARVARHTASPR